MEYIYRVTLVKNWFLQYWCYLQEMLRRDALLVAQQNLTLCVLFLSGHKVFTPVILPPWRRPASIHVTMETSVVLSGSTPDLRQDEDEWAPLSVKRLFDKLKQADLLKSSCPTTCRWSAPIRRPSERCEDRAGSWRSSWDPFALGNQANWGSIHH